MNIRSYFARMPRRARLAARCVKREVAGMRVYLVIFFVSFAGLSCPLADARQDFTPLFSAVGIMQSFTAAKAEITRRIEVHMSLENAGGGIDLPTMTEKERGYLLEGGHVTSTGTLVGFNSKYHVLVVLEPAYRGGVVEWTCKVVPAAASPKSCR